MGRKWAENDRQGKSLNNQISEEDCSVQVKKHWVTLWVCTIRWSTHISQKVISLHNWEVLRRVFIGTRWIINFFWCFVGKFGKLKGPVSIRLKGKKHRFFFFFLVNWKLKQVIIWRLQMRHLFLKKKKLMLHFDGVYSNMVQLLKLTEILERSIALNKKSEH